MALLPETGLETIDYGMPQWNFLVTRAMQLLNGNLLKLNELLDVDPATIADGAILTWDATAGKYVWKVY